MRPELRLRIAKVAMNLMKASPTDDAHFLEQFDVFLKRKPELDAKFRDLAKKQLTEVYALANDSGLRRYQFKILQYVQRLSRRMG